ncbi:MAG: cation:proton antiporter [Flavobacteriales bacterium]
MQHLPTLITDLTLILGAAAVFTLIFKKLKQPVVLGYIIAGLLVGPNFKLFPTVVESEGIKTWAEIGVLFLLFALGLEFSFKKLVKVGGVALITALMGIGFTMLAGYGIGKLLGWQEMDCMFLGGILAIASTTIIGRAFDELGMKSQKFAGVVMGVLIIEDLAAVVLMVILSTVSISRSFEGMEMVYSIIKLIFFLVLWFVSGIFFLPSLLKAVKNYLNDETLLILSIALCFSIVVLAAKAGFSPALGAFIMGSILAETTKAEKIEHVIKSLKDLFGAIFFVSVGMLIDPKMLIEHALPIGLATLVLLIGKPTFVTIGAVLSGQPLKVSVQSGMSLSQLGEFSFIIATLGVTLNVTSDFLYPVAVAVSVVTTFTTPYMIRLSAPMYKVIEKRMPSKWLNSLERYALGAQKVDEENAWKKLLRLYILNVTVFSVVIITIILFGTRFLFVLLPSESSKVISTIISLIVLAPFLWALAFRRLNREVYGAIWMRPLERGPLVALLLSRVALAVFYIGFLFNQLYSPTVAVIGVTITVVVLFIFRKRIKDFYGKIELRFLSNLHDREMQAMVNASPIAPWDSHIATFDLKPYHPYVGMSLMDSKLRENFGVNIAVIRRGDMVINVPKREEKLYPNDVLSVIGTDEQLKHLKEHLEASKELKDKFSDSVEVSLHHFTVTEFSSLLGESIRSSRIRERTNGLVVGIERNGNRILNPESDLVFELGDTIWMVGGERRMQVFIRECQRYHEREKKKAKK